MWYGNIIKNKGICSNDPHWRLEVDKGKTPDECKYIKNEIVLSEMRLNDLGYYSEEK
jgi:hypothetical protein